MRVGVLLDMLAVYNIRDTENVRLILNSGVCQESEEYKFWKTNQSHHPTSTNEYASWGGNCGRNTRKEARKEV